VRGVSGGVCGGRLQILVSLCCYEQNGRQWSGASLHRCEQHQQHSRKMQHAGTPANSVVQTTTPSTHLHKVDVLSRLISAHLVPAVHPQHGEPGGVGDLQAAPHTIDVNEELMRLSGSTVVSREGPSMP
jgi:hypothetical protein